MEDEAFFAEIREMILTMIKDMSPKYNPLNNPLSATQMTIVFSAAFLLFFIFISYKILALYLGLSLKDKHKKHFYSVMHKTEKFKALAEECRNLGETIDGHTNRRLNSKIVSYLTYHIAKELNLDEDTAQLYFCAAMVYDAGFLDSPEELFYMEILDKKEKNLLRTHVQRFYSYLNFVPKEHLAIFMAACLYHHENISGSGYPESLVGTEIPLVARIIRVAESYCALTSKRGYHPACSSKAALKELSKFSGLYDAETVEILAKLV